MSLRLVTELKDYYTVISIKGQRHYIDSTAYVQFTLSRGEKCKSKLSIMGLLVDYKDKQGDLSECAIKCHIRQRYGKNICKRCKYSSSAGNTEVSSTKVQLWLLIMHPLS